MERGKSDIKSGMFTVNGAQRTELVIYMPGTKERFVINDSPHGSGSLGQPLYTIGKKASSGILNSRMKFSSIMTKLKENHEEKMLIKQHEQEEKRWKKQQEKDRLKEEKLLSKEERKRLAAERRLKTNTLPQNFTFNQPSTNDDMDVSGTGNSRVTSNMYRRSLLSFNKMPQIAEDADGNGNSNSQAIIDSDDEDLEAMENVTNDKNSNRTSLSQFMTHAVTPKMDISDRTRSIFSGDPDLQRIEQIYGATLRGIPQQMNSQATHNLFTDSHSKNIVIENLFAHRGNFMPQKSQKKRAPNPPTPAENQSQERLRSNRQSFTAENDAINILDDAIEDTDGDTAKHNVVHVCKDLSQNGTAEPISITGGEIIQITHL